MIHGTHDKHTTISLLGDGLMERVDENGHAFQLPSALSPDAVVEIKMDNDIKNKVHSLENPSGNGEHAMSVGTPEYNSKTHSAVALTGPSQHGIKDGNGKRTSLGNEDPAKIELGGLNSSVHEKDESPRIQHLNLRRAVTPDDEIPINKKTTKIDKTSHVRGCPKL